jgi:hypothetical protein
VGLDHSKEDARMKRWCSAAIAAAVLVVLGATVPAKAAGGFTASWDVDYCYWGTPDAWTYIEVEPNRANKFPYAGWTAYDGTPGSGWPSYSDYSHINYSHPPAVLAQSVLGRLNALGIPLVPPEPQFLGKNPRAAENVILPRPKESPKDKKDKDEE